MFTIVIRMCCKRVEKKNWSPAKCSEFKLQNPAEAAVLTNKEQEISNSRNSGMWSEMHHQYVDAEAHLKP